MFGLNIQGAGAVPIDYKVAYLSEQGGLYVYCSTPGASGVNLLPWQVVDATILIQESCSDTNGTMKVNRDLAEVEKSPTSEKTWKKER